MALNFFAVCASCPITVTPRLRLSRGTTSSRTRSRENCRRWGQRFSSNPCGWNNSSNWRGNSSLSARSSHEARRPPLRFSSRRLLVFNHSGRTPASRFEFRVLVVGGLNRLVPGSEAAAKKPSPFPTHSSVPAVALLVFQDAFDPPLLLVDRPQQFGTRHVRWRGRFRPPPQYVRGHASFS